MENIEDSAVKNWIQAQNNLTNRFLEKIKGKEKIAQRIEELFQYTMIATPKETSNGLFYLKRCPGENRSSLYLKKKAADNEKDLEIKLVDMERLDPSGNKSLDWFFPSPDGRYVAYGVSESGSEWSTLHILDVEKKQVLSEKISRTRFSSIAWKHDSSGFYYTRYPDKGDVPEGEEFYGIHVRYHQLGTNPNEDPIIFQNTNNPRQFLSLRLNEDDSTLVILASQFVSMDLYLVKLEEDTPLVRPILVNNTFRIISLELFKDSIYLLCNKDYENYAVYRARLTQMEPQYWELLIADDNKILQQLEVVDNQIILFYYENIVHKVAVYNIEGQRIRELPLPDNGSILALYHGYGTKHVYIHFVSFFTPQIFYYYNVATNKLQVLHKADTQISADEFTVTRVWYPSKDQTQIHMFILHKKDLKLNGKNPCILTGYGGFGISRTPDYFPHALFWAEHGGVFALANLRGGGEFGERWYRAGRLDKKQNVFDDFIAAAEYLIHHGYCSPKTLGILGGSNGGLLVGAALTQRPDLFNAVYCAVPLLDMLRYHKFLMAAAWIPEYGNPNNPKHFEWLYRYSPYHNTKEGIKYPAVFFYTAIADSRVHPAHALKMTALLQHLNRDLQNPILLRVETQAGHGIADSLAIKKKRIVEALLFLSWRLNLSLE